MTTIVATIVLCTTTSGGAVGQATGSSTAVDIRELERAPSVRCPSARSGLRFYRGRFRDWVTLRGAALPVTRTGRAPRNCADARYLAVVWQGRSFAARTAYEHWYVWAWRDWLPANWLMVGTCETHMDFDHHNRKYVSAFGISRREYDDDAAVFGGPPWNNDRPPSPRDQYNAARGHYARFGDGWTCPGP